MTEKNYNVLFLCTGNSARSIMAEVLLNHLGRGRFKAYSAGSFPSGKVNPFSIDTLRNMGLPADGLRSKSWDEFTLPGAPRIDFIFTVCANAAGEACPVWPGRPASAHWGVDDPAACEGAEDLRRAAFRDAALILRRRIEFFVNLPLEKLDAPALKRELDHIGCDSNPAPA
jgi:arsenate reductase